MDNLNRQFLKAAEFYKLNDLQAFLGQGADINAKDKNGWSALHWVASYGNLECVIYLLKNGADIAAKNNMECTALHSAAERGDLPCLKHLVEHGINIHGQDRYNWSAVHYAAYNGHVDCTRYLLEQGVDPTINDKTGKTALDYAVEAKYTKIIETIQAVTQQLALNSLIVECRSDQQRLHF